MPITAIAAADRPLGQPGACPVGPRLCDTTGRPLRILVAEDELMVAQVLQDMVVDAAELCRAIHRTCTAATAR